MGGCCIGGPKMNMGMDMDMNGDKVNLIEQMNLGGCVLLLMGQGRRRFRLVVMANDQTRDQWHRLRVLRAAQ